MGYMVVSEDRTLGVDNEDEAIKVVGAGEKFGGAINRRFGWSRRGRWFFEAGEHLSTVLEGYLGFLPTEDGRRRIMWIRRPVKTERRLLCLFLGLFMALLLGILWGEGKGGKLGFFVWLKVIILFNVNKFGCWVMEIIFGGFRLI